MKATFRRKPLMEELLPQDKFVIRDVVILSEEEFKHFHPLVGYDFIRQRKHLMLVDENEVWNVIMVTSKEAKHAILIQSEGYDYARYAAYISKKGLSADPAYEKTIRNKIYKEESNKWQ